MGHDWSCQGLEGRNSLLMGAWEPDEENEQREKLWQFPDLDIDVRL